MQVMKWSALALAVTAGTTQLAFASAQSDSKGFVEDSNLTLLNKNYALYRDFRNNGVNNGGSADDPFVAESRDKDQAYDDKHDNDTRGQIRLLHN